MRDGLFVLESDPELRSQFLRDGRLPSKTVIGKTRVKIAVLSNIRRLALDAF